MEKKREVVVFDFDGTLTKKDTFLEFIKFVFGKRAFCIGFFIHSPLLLLMKLGLYPNSKTKQQVFSWYFKGMSYDKFAKLGDKFADVIVKNEETFNILQKHKSEESEIYVISASIEEWVRPFCFRAGIMNILATQVGVDSQGTLTGKFTTSNCYGKEKVHRLLEVEPDREEYYLYAYGDSKGDKDIILFADKGAYIK